MLLVRLSLLSTGLKVLEFKFIFLFLLIVLFLSRIPLQKIYLYCYHVLHNPYVYIIITQNPLSLYILTRIINNTSKKSQIIDQVCRVLFKNTCSTCKLLRYRKNKLLDQVCRVIFKNTCSSLNYTIIKSIID